MKTSRLLELCLYLPVNFFQPKLFVFVVLFQAYAMTSCEQEVQRIHDVFELEPKRQLDFQPIFHAISYTLCAGAVLLTTTYSKRYFARPRPPFPDYSDPKTLNARGFDMRSVETNCSFPSGDAAQAAMFMFTIMSSFPKSSMLLGGPAGCAQFVLIVAFSRIYFHCHYMGDVCFGIFIGIVVGMILNKIGFKDNLKTVYLSTVGLS